ncbi:hypothetical protein DUI87_07625 [Hirundo rustica rustica]|uniref:Uncharacterized protein n=1 Tax=Hirundo rustica rustica TaxID=333673 RepID=A0A3M0KVI8_HIRRU|nr:hypothetical protein DUI87_07625 [Hirundo rustica rustica]
MNQPCRLMSAERSGSVWFVSSLLPWSHNSLLAVDGLCRADHSANPLIVWPQDYDPASNGNVSSFTWCHAVRSAAFRISDGDRPRLTQKLLLQNEDVPVIMNTYFSQKVLLSEHSEAGEKTYALTKTLIRKNIISLAQTFRLDDFDDKLHQESSGNQKRQEQNIEEVKIKRYSRRSHKG